jgi:hypothetical protein
MFILAKTLIPFFFIASSYCVNEFSFSNRHLLLRLFAVRIEGRPPAFGAWSRAATGPFLGPRGENPLPPGAPGRREQSHSPPSARSGFAPAERHRTPTHGSE